MVMINTFTAIFLNRYTVETDFISLEKTSTEIERTFILFSM